MPSEFKTLSSKVVYENKWMRVREDAIERPSGQQGIYSVMEKPDFTVVIPVQDGYVYMVEQYRYPVEKRQLEFPQGTWEEEGDADPAELAAGELQEETGLLAKNWTIPHHRFPVFPYFSSNDPAPFVGEKLPKVHPPPSPQPQPGGRLEKVSLSNRSSSAAIWSWASNRCIGSIAYNPPGP